MKWTFGRVIDVSFVAKVGTVEMRNKDTDRRVCVTKMGATSTLTG